MTRLAVILVHYHTPRLLREALAAVRAGTRELGPAVETIVVDNGSDPQDGGLAGLDATVIRPGVNLGYAGGVNLGVSTTGAEHLVLMNPDVLVGPECISRLLDRLRSGAGAVGPRLWWDRGRTLLLPPTERRGVVDEALRARATRSERWARRARRRWRAHALRHWASTTPLRSYTLSGGLLAVARRAWEEVGGFDEGYRLYFEETDWLQRLRRAGLDAFHEPRAEAVHLYARSASAEARFGAWFAASEERFRRRHLGTMSRWVIRRLASPGRERPGSRGGEGGVEAADPALGPGRAGSFSRTVLPPGPPGGSGTEPPSFPCRLRSGERAAWMELSPGSLGFPAAAARVAPSTSAWTIPGEVWQRLEPGVHAAQAVDEDGRELAHWSFRVPGPSPTDPAGARSRQD